MPFFKFDYDPSNPRLGDRVIITGNLLLNSTLAPEWYHNRKGGEYYISGISRSREDITLSSPFDSEVNIYTWRPDWLSPAPLRIPNGTQVMCPSITDSDMYENNTNWASEMSELIYTPMSVSRTSDSGAYFFTDGHTWSWHRSWLFIMPEAQLSNSSPKPRFKEGDLVLVKDSIIQNVTNAKGIIRCASHRYPFTYRIEMYGKIQVVSESRLILVERDGQYVFERNSIEAKDLVF